MQLIKTCIYSLASDPREVKMLIVENVTEAEADGLRQIIKQQANEIVELETRLEFSSKTLHRQSLSKESLNTLPNARIKFYRFCVDKCA